MCGIFCQICYSNDDAKKDPKVLERIKNRGPDCDQELSIKVNDKISLFFYGSVLWMQGQDLTPQPLKTENGVLLFNGDIFDETWSNEIVSDTQIIMEKLNSLTSSNREKNIINILKTLKGPFSLIYYDIQTHNLYFTRDRIGRSSLLFHKTESTVIISSVLGRDYKCVEVTATHINVLNLDTFSMKTHCWLNDGYEELDLDAWLEGLERLQSQSDEEHKFDGTFIDSLVEQDGIIDYMKSTAITPCKATVMNNLLDNDIINETVTKLTSLLEKSVQIRLETQPMKCKDCLLEEYPCKHCTVGILFSGGLDCTILAWLADKYLPKDQPIDLLNVAFKKEQCGNYDVPDRLTGKQSFEELKKICPMRTWVFQEINVTMDELYDSQKNFIADLVYPRKTILDESLGSALWFAARGVAEALSSCRVLLVGSGADELFGGYTRHRNAFKRNGWSGLHKELWFDWMRISFRNLARDNRVICDHGRQPRMPYLDEDFTECVLSLPPWLRCFPGEELGPGIGDKLMLRLVAFKLGLQNAATFPKRALQFGSRIANKKEKGSDTSKSFMINK